MSHGHPVLRISAVTERRYPALPGSTSEVGGTKVNDLQSSTAEAFVEFARAKLST